MAHTTFFLEFEIAGEASVRDFRLFGDAWCGNLCSPKQFGVFEKVRLSGRE
jgi:hypothetical protein